MEIAEVKNIWEKVKEELKKSISPSSFDPWIAPLEPIGYDEDQFTVITGQSLAIQIIRKNHYKEISETFQKILGKNVEFNIIFDEELAKKIKKELQKEQAKKEKKADPKENLARMQSFSNLNLKYKFDNFVVGENNKIAKAAAMQVAKNPSSKFNPLFIYGGSGLGKTHLMQAIGHYNLFNNSKLKVRYIKTEEFANEYIDNLRPGKDKSDRLTKFHQKYRNVDILLIDDIQFIESKNGIMEMIFNTFDNLLNKNKQIVITSDRLPKDIPTLTDRLRTRFEMGLVVDVTPPDFDTRLAILTNLADMNGIKLDISTLEYIAQNFERNVRELEGAFNKVTAYADIQGVEPTLEFAKSVLKCEERKKIITISDITEKCAEYFDVTIKDLKSTARNQKISNARRITVFLIREMLNVSYKEIAEYFNKKHPTILYSCEKTQKELNINSDLQAKIADIKKLLK